MNHPKPEVWVPYVYGETSGAARHELRAHLKACPQCREEVESWKRSLKRLKDWEVPRERRPERRLLAPVMGWAAAAALVLFAGVLLGRASAPRVNAETLRREVAAQIQAELGSQMGQLARQEAARTAALSLASSHRYTDQMAQQLWVMIKKDVDTLALNADARFQHTAQELFQLADDKEPQVQIDPNK